MSKLKFVAISILAFSIIFGGCQKQEAKKEPEKQVEELDKDELKDYKGEDIKDYEKIVEEEKAFQGDVISWEELLKRCENAEAFIDKYEDSEKTSLMKELYIEYMGMLIFGDESTPAIDYDTLNIDEGYIKFLKDNMNENGSDTKEYLFEYNEILKSNNYKMNDDLENRRSQLFEEIREDIN